ncbi:VOC family protein [Humibacter sp.]|jgi:catechol 2,3-dioxygenase-like lactoylglutathione lyase family enzyme|uniref:VOC family protein n=1 Tax=Humibacter sp. TaxID=1940291 RepID=UPI002B756E7E|nr:VOC family protein [Humibacter sp.]HVX07370.1 VOC family protein [Humibacter sp.]
MIGTFDVLAIDCPDPSALAQFYGELLGMQVVSDDPDWVELASETRPRPLVAFQKVEGEYRPPQWPGQDVPQQMHIDVKVDDLDAGEQQVLALGATKAGYDQETFRVYLDPAGHPFCLVKPND